MAVKRKGDLRRPYAPSMLKRAKEIVARYRFIVGPDDDSDEFVAASLEFPDQIGVAETEAAAIAECRALTISNIAYRIEQGMSVPIAGDATRSQQINIRVTPEEKLRMETIAAVRGFVGIASYVRAVALKD